MASLLLFRLRWKNGCTRKVNFDLLGCVGSTLHRCNRTLKSFFVKRTCLHCFGFVYFWILGNGCSRYQHFLLTRAYGNRYKLLITHSIYKQSQKFFSPKVRKKNVKNACIHLIYKLNRTKALEIPTYDMHAHRTQTRAPLHCQHDDFFSISILYKMCSLSLCVCVCIRNNAWNDPTDSARLWSMLTFTCLLVCLCTLFTPMMRTWRHFSYIFVSPLISWCVLEWSKQ